MSLASKNQDLNIVGSTEFIDVAGFKNVPAKIDTGADTSAIWASNIKMEKDGALAFSLFDKESPFYTGEIIKTKDYKAKMVRSSHGDRQVRYRVVLPITLKKESFKAAFTLADRSKNNFPILIGRRTIKGKYLVDVSRESITRPKPSSTTKLNRELENNPIEFHQKYIKAQKGEL